MQHCSKCNFVSQTRHELKAHWDSEHLIIRIAKHQCQLCSMKMHSPDKLLGHLEAVHFNARKWKCEFCDVSKNYKQCLIKHMKKSHRENVDQDLTKNCLSESVQEEEMSESSETNRQPEKRSRHVEEVPLSAVVDKQCPHCEYVTSRQERLSIHVKVAHKKIRDVKYAQSGKSHEKTERDFVTNIASEKFHNKHEATILSEVHIKEKKIANIVIDQLITSNHNLTDVYMSTGNQKLDQNTLAPNTETLQQKGLLKVKDKKCTRCDYMIHHTGHLSRHVKEVH
jgi:hypothetical protein